MDWIFDHLQFVIAAAAAVAYWLNQRRTAEKEKAEADRQPATRLPRTQVDESQDAEQARRIREEIRRKIAERAEGRPVRAPATQTPPLVRHDAEALRRVFHPETAPAPVRKPLPVPDDGQMAAVMERQRKLQEQMAALEFSRLMEKRAARPVATGVADVSNAPRAAGDWRSDLRGKDGLRRAIVLREIFGPPVALR